MKKILTSIAVSLVALQAQATTMTMVGVGQEKVGSLTVDLYQVGIGQRFGNGVSVMGSVLKGYPTRAGLTKETRPELQLGYDTRIGRWAPYANVLIGQRQFINQPHVDYYAVRVGTRYGFSQNFYGDLSYRYRDTDQTAWKSHLYSAGFGIMLDKTNAVQINYGRTNGDYTSNQLGVYLISRF